MEHTDFDGIIFADTLQDFNALRHTGRVIHILCSGGNMGFTFQDTRYHIAAGEESWRGFLTAVNSRIMPDAFERQTLLGEPLR